MEEDLSKAGLNQWLWKAEGVCGGKRPKLKTPMVFETMGISWSWLLRSRRPLLCESEATNRLLPVQVSTSLRES